MSGEVVSNIKKRWYYRWTESDQDVAPIVETIEHQHHVQEHRDDDELGNCETTIATASCENEHDLNERTRIRITRLQFQCHFCQKWLSSKQSLEKHSMGIHRRHSLPSVVKEQEEQLHVCNTCNRKFKYKRGLQRHVNSDPEHVKTLGRYWRGEHLCDVCGNMFLHKGNLQRHVKRYHKRSDRSSASASASVITREASLVADKDF